MEPDLSSWTKPQLKDQLRNLGLSPSGNKADLIKRIQQHSLLTGVIDVDREILLRLNTNDLLNACKTNKYAIKLCSDKQFMKLLVERKFKENANKALLNAVTHGYLLFVKYLVENHDISMQYHKYAAFNEAIYHALINFDYDIMIYLVKTSKVKHLERLLRIFIETDNSYIIGIIEHTDIIRRLIDEHIDILPVFDTYMSEYNKLPASNIEYINMLRYLYKNLDKATFLKVLRGLSNGDGEFYSVWT